MTTQTHLYDDVIDEYRGQQVACNEQIQSLIARADAEVRDLTDEETSEISKLTARFEQLEKNIATREKVRAQISHLSTSIGPKVEKQLPTDQMDHLQDAYEPENVPRRRRPMVEVIDAVPHKGKWGWRTFGEFSRAVIKAARRGNPEFDPRLLRNAPTTYANESAGADGGFAVPPDFRADIMSMVTGETSLLGRCDQLQASSNVLVLPKDEDTPWGTTGIQAYWEGEGDQKGQSKPAMEQITVKLNKLAVLVPITDELMEDAPALDSYLRRKVPEKMDFKVSLAIVQGTGVGQPLGILNSPCLVSVTKDSAQVADTISYTNVVNMWSRLYGPCRQNAVWLINQSIEPQLFKLAWEGTSNSVPAYMPQNGLSGQPYSTLMGRPVIPTEACETLGDKGDIILADLTKYLAVTRAGSGMRTDTSIHLYFDYDVTAFRVVFRVAGQPWWRSTIAQRDGSVTLSPFVTLNERS